MNKISKVSFIINLLTVITIIVLMILRQKVPDILRDVYWGSLIVTFAGTIVNQRKKAFVIDISEKIICI